MTMDGNELIDGKAVGRRRRDDPTFTDDRRRRDDRTITDDRQGSDDPIDHATTVEVRVVVEGATDIPAGKGPDDERVAARRAYLRLIARRLRKNVSAFTLVELLVVIAVIAMLAGLLIGVLPRAMEKRVTARVEADLALLTTMIEYYKEKNGFYPPDNPNNVAEPPLFYELVGTTNSGGDFYPLNGDPKLSSADIQTAFGTSGFLNSGEAGEVKSFHKTIRENQYNWSPFPKAIPVRVLTVMANGPKYPANPGTETTNTWRYVVGKPDGLQPVHNPSSYDLWAEVVYRGRTNVIGNWRR
jgi:prepilin-type N-terminal cleavage/methylation domain-containing protein